MSKPGNKAATLNTYFTANTIIYTANGNSSYWNGSSSMLIDKIFYTIRNKYTGQISSAAISITTLRSSQYLFPENIAMILEPYSAFNFSPLLNVNEYYFDQNVTLSEVDKIDFSSFINAVNLMVYFIRLQGAPQISGSS